MQTINSLVFNASMCLRPLNSHIFKFTAFALVVFLAANTMANTPKIEPGVSKELAVWRAGNYSDVRYKIDLKLEKLAPALKGTIEISLQSKSDTVILDWRKIRGSETISKISNVSVNRVPVTLKPHKNGPSQQRLPVYEEYAEHLVFIDGVIVGENVIKLDFESPILKSGGAITRYNDSEDGSEYIYSLFVPSDASTAFPVFDQPDLKARFKLSVDIAGKDRPSDWKIVSNENGKSGFDSTWATKWIFEETKPISTYVFAFAAGPFAEIKDDASKPVVAAPGIDARRNEGSNTASVSHRVFLRKSQAEKFKPHAEEVFRLNREAIKYFEKYFDYKFPFPKYDVVLIPEFPFGGMEHAGATFLRERSIIFPTEPTANNYISRASLIFHEAAHQWFGDTVTMKWFDDLWLKEGFATFMAYKAMDEIMPEYDVWKVFYERVKNSAYQTDITKGTTPIYQEIPNLNSAKSAYGNIVYQKAPSFLRQAEYYFGEDEFRTAVKTFLKKNEYGNAEWSDLVKEFEAVDCIANKATEVRMDAKGEKAVTQKCVGEPNRKADLTNWADSWIKGRGVSVIHVNQTQRMERGNGSFDLTVRQENAVGEKNIVPQRLAMLKRYEKSDSVENLILNRDEKMLRYKSNVWDTVDIDPAKVSNARPLMIFPNFGDKGYGIFLLNKASRAYILGNIRSEEDPFLRSMMWGALWDSVLFEELDPAEYVELAIKNIDVETDETTIAAILGRVGTAHTFYLNDSKRKDFGSKLEQLLMAKMKGSKSNGELLTYYRAYLDIAESQDARSLMKMVASISANGNGATDGVSGRLAGLLKSKDRFDIATRLIVLRDADAQTMLETLEKKETDDASRRDAYAAKAGFPTPENKKKYFDDFINNKEIPESWIEAAFDVWNAPSQDELTLPYLERALAELPNLKRDRKIFFVNGWLGAFIRGQRSEKALKIVNGFLKENPNLDADLRRKILENADGLERAVSIRNKYS